MGNESGEWNMHGTKCGNPKCIHSVDEAIVYINELGFLPLFKSDIDGFSLEERAVPECWWSDNPEIDPWMLQAIIARWHDIVYGSIQREGLGKKISSCRLWWKVQTLA